MPYARRADANPNALRKCHAALREGTNWIRGIVGRRSN